VREPARRPRIPAGTVVRLTDEGERVLASPRARVVALDCSTRSRLPDGYAEDVYQVRLESGEPALLGTGWVVWPAVG
jgi:hypothetical protein